MTELSESITKLQQDLDTLKGAERKRAYQRLWYKKRALELGLRGSGIKRLQREVAILEAKSTNPEAQCRDLLISQGLQYNPIVRKTLLEMEPKIDQILELMSDTSARDFIKTLKDRAHEHILTKYNIDGESSIQSN